MYRTIFRISLCLFFFCLLSAIACGQQMTDKELPQNAAAERTYKLFSRAGTLPPAGVSGERKPLSYSETFLYSGNREVTRIFTDYSNLYSKNNVRNYGLALAGAGIMANTKIDGNFQKWYGGHVRCNFTKEFSEFSKWFGEGQIFIPVTITSAFTYRFLQERWKKTDNPRPLFEWTDRTMRGYFTGFPALLVIQLATGGDRPNSGSSYWHPFQQDHGASGHAFIGAVPFITAAQMTDKPCLKGLFYTLSAVSGCSRVNDGAHYLSQVLLGWYLAHLSVRAVSATEGSPLLPRGLAVFPVTENNAAGIGLFYQY